LGILAFLHSLGYLSRKVLDPSLICCQYSIISIISIVSNVPTQTISASHSAKIGSDSGWPAALNVQQNQLQLLSGVADKDGSLKYALYSEER